MFMKLVKKYCTHSMLGVLLGFILPFTHAQAAVVQSASVSSIRFKFGCWPLPWKSFTIKYGFGNRMSNDSRLNGLHSGLDISCPTGTPLIAPAAGTIIYSRKDIILGGRRYNAWAGYGLGIDHGIHHGHRIKTFFAHIDDNTRKLNEGAQVQAGDCIGYSGNSGNSTGPHLHFECHVDGQPCDPLLLLPGIEAGFSIDNKNECIKEGCTPEKMLNVAAKFPPSESSDSAAQNNNQGNSNQANSNQANNNQANNNQANNNQANNTNSNGSNEKPSLSAEQQRQPVPPSPNTQDAQVPQPPTLSPQTPTPLQNTQSTDSSKGTPLLRKNPKGQSQEQMGTNHGSVDHSANKDGSKESSSFSFVQQTPDVQGTARPSSSISSQVPQDGASSEKNLQGQSRESERSDPGTIVSHGNENESNSDSPFSSNQQSSPPSVLSTQSQQPTEQPSIQIDDDAVRRTSSRQHRWIVQSQEEQENTDCDSAPDMQDSDSHRTKGASGIRNIILEIIDGIMSSWHDFCEMLGIRSFWS